MLQVRYRKAMRGSSPKRRIALTVLNWSAEIVADWLECGHPHKTDELDGAQGWRWERSGGGKSSMLPTPQGGVVHALRRPAAPCRVGSRG